MDINITLFGELLTFGVLVWVMARYVLPPINQAIETRQQQIAAGLAAAEQGQRELVQVQQQVVTELGGARAEAATIIQQARQRADLVIEEATVTAQRERARILRQVHIDLERELIQSREAMQHQMVDLVVATTERVLQSKLDHAMQNQLIDKFITNIDEP